VSSVLSVVKKIVKSWISYKLLRNFFNHREHRAHREKKKCPVHHLLTVFNSVDEAADVIDGCIGQDTMAEIDDEAGFPFHFI
jgi:hypothetical protein